MLININPVQSSNIKSKKHALSRHNDAIRNHPLKQKDFSIAQTQTYKSNLVPFLGNRNILSKELFVKEKLLNENDNFNEFFNNLFNKIFPHDKEKNAKQKAMNYVRQGKIALSKSLYRTALKDDGAIGACSALVTTQTNPKAHIMNGLGLAINLKNRSNPVEILTATDLKYQDYAKDAPRVSAGIALIDVTNPGIEKFINYHNNKNYEDTCFSTSVCLKNDFLKQVDEDSSIKLSNGKAIKAKELYRNIISSISKRGNPGIIFEEKLNNANPIPSRPFDGISTCAEMGLEQGEQSSFSYINLSKFLNPTTKKIDYKEMTKATQSLTKLMDNVIDINLSNGKYSSDAEKSKRRFGIGVCGYADLIAKMGHEYGSPEALKVLGNCLETINYASKVESANLAKTKGEFPLFSKSRYNEMDFLIKHNENNDSPITNKMWQDLHQQVQRTGLRNATTTSLPPTCSSARMTGSSYSIEPFLTLKDNKSFQNSLQELKLPQEQKKQVMQIVEKTGSIQDIDFLSDKFKKAFKTATEVDAFKHLDTVNEAQRFVDDCISKTVNLPNGTTHDDIDEVIRYANDKNIKGITIFVDNISS